MPKTSHGSQHDPQHGHNSKCVCWKCLKSNDDGQMLSFVTWPVLHACFWFALEGSCSDAAHSECEAAIIVKNVLILLVSNTMHHPARHQWLQQSCRYKLCVCGRKLFPLRAHSQTPHPHICESQREEVISTLIQFAHFSVQSHDVLSRHIHWHKHIC